MPPNSYPTPTPPRLLLRRQHHPVPAQHLPLPPLRAGPALGLGAGAPGHQLGAAARPLGVQPATRWLPRRRGTESVRPIREYCTVHAASWSSLYGLAIGVGQSLYATYVSPRRTSVLRACFPTRLVV